MNADTMQQLSDFLQYKQIAVGIIGILTLMRLVLKSGAYRSGTLKFRLLMSGAALCCWLYGGAMVLSSVDEGTINLNGFLMMGGGLVAATAAFLSYPGIRVRAGIMLYLAPPATLILMVLFFVLALYALLMAAVLIWLISFFQLFKN